MRKLCAGTFLIGLLCLCGCRTTVTRLHIIKHDTVKTYDAPYAKVWAAAREAMKDYELVVTDSDDEQQSGLLISDWIKGKSDTYRYKDENGEMQPCDCEYSLHASVEGKNDKTVVDVKIYEKTLMVTPEGKVWRKTESSTLREKKILDTIDALLKE